MKLTWKNTLVPGATMLAAVTLYSSGIAQGHGGNSAASVGHVPAKSPVQGAELGVAGHRIFGISPQGGSTAVYGVNTGTPSAVNLGSTGTTNGSGLTRQPGTNNYYMSGGNNDGGNIYIAGLGSSVLLGPSGFPNVSGLAFDPSNGKLYGTATVSILSDGLIEIDPSTGAGTLVGGGMGIGGIDSIAFDPTDGTLYASTGFFYDGSPGDKLIINPATGVASDTGQDMTPTPACTVAGMAFAKDGTGYVSVGCGTLSLTGGDIHRWDPATNQLSFVLNPSAPSSISDIAVGR